ncbi:MAG: transposase [bacterium]
MPRHFINENHAHYLTFGCYKRQHLFTPEELRTLFLQQLELARERYAFKLYAWVVMPNHIHLLLHPLDTPLSTILRGIKRPFSTKAFRWYEQHKPLRLETMEIKRGKYVVRRFWQEGGGYDRNLYSPEAIYKSITYIHNNSVRAGLVENILEWRWSSTRFYELKESVGLNADELPGL